MSEQQPDGPGEPDAADEPGTPDSPATPDGPAAPATPDGPAAPANPAAPGEPGEPPLSRRARRKERTRARRAARREQPWWRRCIPTWRTALGATVALVLLCVGAFALAYASVSVPDPNSAATAQSNVYYYADGKTEIGQTGSVNRVSVPIDAISLDMQHAAVSAEDRTFYSNKGVSITGMLRAAWNTLTGQGLQGGSTITQQYVKNYYLTQTQTVSRKVKEFFISLKVDRTESKDDIMAGYLNTSYFGRNAYGVQSAAKAYYGEDASGLTVPQAAYLAALLQAPSAYDVATATQAGKDAAVARWNYVLDGMVELGWVSQSDRDAMKFPSTEPLGATGGVGGQAGYLIDIADHYLNDSKVIDAATLAAGGWRITTTFVKADQDAMVKSIKDEFAAALPDTADAKHIRAGSASVDVATGKLVAAYGGPDYSTQEFNDALRTDLQVGSTFKAIDLAAGLENHATTQDGRVITPATLYDGTSGREVQGLPDGQSYAPPNEDYTDYGWISLREAMTKSVNSVYAQEGADAGLDNVRKAAISVGLPEDTPAMHASDPSITLGVATPDVISMAGAYATLADHGKQTTPWCVTAAVRDGEAKELPGHSAATGLRRGTADDVTSVLQDVLTDAGTGYIAQGLGRPAAGKTGTTDANLNAWFIGYTPQLATSVALFAENPDTHDHESIGKDAGVSRINGGAIPTEIWTSYMTIALASQPVQDFDLQTDYSTATTAPTTTAPTTAPATTAPATTAPASEPATTTPATTTPATTVPATTTPATTSAGPQNGNAPGDAAAPRKRTPSQPTTPLSNQGRSPQSDRAAPP